MTKKIFSADERRRIQRVVEEQERRPKPSGRPQPREWRPPQDGYDPNSGVGENKCDCSFEDSASHDCFGATNVMPAKFIADDLGEFGTDVVVTWDSSDADGCEFISDEEEVSC